MIYKSAEYVRHIYKKAGLRERWKAHQRKADRALAAHKRRERQKALQGSFIILDGPGMPPGVSGMMLHPSGRHTWLPDEKQAGLPTEMEPRKRVAGLKVPRLATPRLGAGTPEGKVPANPYRGNWVRPKGVEKTAVDVGLVHAADPAFFARARRALAHPRYRLWERGAYSGAVASHRQLPAYHHELQAIGGRRTRLRLPNTHHGGLVLPGLNLGAHPESGKDVLLHPIVTLGQQGTPEISTVFHDEMLGGKYIPLAQEHITNVDPAEAKDVLKRIRRMTREASPDFLGRMLSGDDAKKAVNQFRRIERGGGRRPALTDYARRLIR